MTRLWNYPGCAGGAAVTANHPFGDKGHRQPGGVTQNVFLSHFNSSMRIFLGRACDLTKAWARAVFANLSAVDESADEPSDQTDMAAADENVG